MKSNIIIAPASKSYLQRALAISALADGSSVLKNSSYCDDSLVAKRIIQDLGSEVIEQNGDLIVKSKGLFPKKKTFCAGESGLSVRMFSPILSLSDKEVVFTGDGSLLKRPIQIIADALEQLGAQVNTQKGFLPLTIKGRIKSGKVEIDGSLSSQLLSGLLITLPLLDGDSEILVNKLKSKPYIEMTLSIMRYFGVEVSCEDYKVFKIKGNQKYKATEYNIEGDWSASSFFLVAGAVKGRVQIENLNLSSAQADKEIITVLRQVGAIVSFDKDTVVVEKNKLNAFEFDATDCPDLFPPLVCLASQCNGKSEIKGVSRLTHKESNRAEVLKNEFAKIGVEIEIENDSMYIESSIITEGTIDSNHDHRIAMAAGIMNLFTDGNIEIEKKEAINKSYPNFFNDLYKLSF